MVWERLASASVSSSVTNTGWKLLKRASGTGVNITTDTFADKDNIMILHHTHTGSSTGTAGLRFNADTNGNYANRFSTDDGSDNTSQVNASNILNGVGYANRSSFAVNEIVNVPTQPKLLIGHATENGGNNSSSIPNRREIVGVWNNSSNGITSATLHERDGNGWGSSSEIIVLGCDNNESDSGENFWQELGSVELTSNSASSGTASNPQMECTFTAKNYLMFEGYLKSNGDPQTCFNQDAGGNYHWSYVDDGSGSDASGGSNNSSAGFHYGGNEVYIRGFMVNKTGSQKQWIIDRLYNSTTGTGNTLVVREGSGKWNNTSAQCNSIGFKKNSMTMYAGSYFKVWGAD